MGALTEKEVYSQRSKSIANQWECNRWEEDGSVVGRGHKTIKEATCANFGVALALAICLIVQRSQASMAFGQTLGLLGISHL